MAKKKLPVPEVNFSSWTALDAAGNLVEKGITAQWELPDDVHGMLLEVGDLPWGPYTDSPHTLNIPYEQPDDLVLPVSMRYVILGQPLAFNLSNQPDHINLILSDIVITRSINTEDAQDFGPLTEYPDDLVETFLTGNFWEIRHGDKYRNGKFRAIHLTLQNGATTVTCIVRPGNNGDELITTGVLPTQLQGAFSDNGTDASQKYVETTAFGGANPVVLKTFRDDSRDQVVVQLFNAASNWTVTAKLHRYS